MRELHPLDLIDRVAERELFADLVSFTSEARMLTICDRGGRGKSSLLKRLQYDCLQISPRKAACLIDLGNVKPSAFTLIEAIHTQLAGINVDGAPMGDRFARFKQRNEQRCLKNPAIFGDRARLGSASGRAARAEGRAVVRGPVGKGANVTGTWIENANFAAPSGFTEEQEQLARTKCVEAFFEDLPVVCATHPVILMFDAWERCNLQLRDWVVERILRSECCHPDPNMRPAKLAVVVAGRAASPAEPFGLRPDDFRLWFESDADMDTSIKSIKSLSDWDTEHVRQFMSQNGYDASELEIELLRVKLKEGLTFEKAVELIGILKAPSRQSSNFTPAS